MSLRRASQPWALLSLSLSLAAAPAQAEPVAQVVPYSGFLDRDGAPVDGQAQLRFRVYTSAAAASAAEQDPCDGAAQADCVWQEVHPEVAVHNGAFQVRLGRPAGAGQPRDLAPLLRTGQQLHLEVAVFDAASQQYATLGRQTISPAPQAVFTLQRDIAVGTLTADVVNTQALTTGSATADRVDATDVHAGALTVQPAGAGALTLTPGALQSTAANGLPVPLELNGAGGGLSLSAPGAPVQIQGPVQLSAGVEITFGGGRPFAGLQPSADGFGAIRDARGIVESAALALAPNDGRHVCFLTTVLFTDYGDNFTQNCTIYPINGNLSLIAQGDPTSANRLTSCRARCLSW